MYGVWNSPHCHELHLTLSFWEFFLFFFGGGWLVHWPSPVNQQYIYIYTLKPMTRPFFWSQKNGSSQPATSWVLGIVESCDEMILRHLAKTQHQENRCVAHNVAWSNVASVLQRLVTSVFIKFIFHNCIPINFLNPKNTSSNDFGHHGSRTPHS